MNIKELKAKLSEYPDDMRVVAHDGEYEDFYDIQDIYPVDAARVTEQSPGEKVLKLSPFDDGANR